MKTSVETCIKEVNIEYSGARRIFRLQGFITFNRKEGLVCPEGEAWQEIARAGGTSSEDQKSPRKHPSKERQGGGGSFR